MTLELFTMSIPEPSLVELFSTRAEAEGWDGITFTDSQNLVADPFIGIAIGARVTERLQFMTGVSNPATRHPAALATVAATVQETSGGRMTLGLGRGDTALFHLGRHPQSLNEFFARTDELHTYLNGGVVDIDGYPSQIRWLARAQQPRVPIDIASSGPKVIAYAARTVERITFAVGADPERMAWAVDLARAAMKDAGRTDGDVSFGAYVTVACHPDAAKARALVKGSVAAFAHFSAMPGSTGAGLDERDRELVAEVGRTYDSNMHLVNSADHAQVLPDEFIDRFAVIGDASACAKRLHELVSLGLERLVITGPSFGADREDANTHRTLVCEELLPALR
ncbi:MAG TPA: LLM class flavin-dependent oxidoreductase [Acidimicrobiia bacterium]|nr:LLM class flavin-dependent oxidoreductase [Acidimicrobiia bacterium]